MVDLRTQARRLLVLGLLRSAQPFSAPRRRTGTAPVRTARVRRAAARSPEVCYHDYDGWRCAYRRYDGCSPAVVLLHPIGLGLSGWFWTKVAEALPNEVFVPDFVGCGLSDPWDPDERGMSLPGAYARQVEALWRERIGKPCVVATQGGIAPVGVLLASRSSDDWDGARAVAGLALVSPPTWRDIAGGLDRREVAKNYEQLTSRLGRWGFDVLRREAFVRFFSDLFLFAGACDDAWVANCLEDDARPKSEQPVLAFNAGIVNARPLYDELATCVDQPVRVVEGAGDKRARDRGGYEDAIVDCDRVTIPSACNVVGWENPEATAAAVSSLVAKARKRGRLDEEDVIIVS